MPAYAAYEALCSVGDRQQMRTDLAFPVLVAKAVHLAVARAANAVAGPWPEISGLVAFRGSQVELP